MGQPANNANKKVIYKICASFSNCFIRINNMQDIDAQDIDVAMPMCNIIEYSEMQMVGDIVDFNAANATSANIKLFKAQLNVYYFTVRRISW